MENQEVASVLNNALSSAPPLPQEASAPALLPVTTVSAPSPGIQTKSQLPATVRQSRVLGAGFSLLLFGGLLSLGLIWDNSSHGPIPVAANVNSATNAITTTSPGFNSGSPALPDFGLSPQNPSGSPFNSLLPSNPPAAKGHPSSGSGQGGLGAKAPAAQPTNPAAQRLAQGMAGQRAGKNQEAITAYQQALQLNPALTPARIGLAMLYWQGHRSDEALQQLRLAQHNDPKNPAIPWQIAQTLLSLHRTPEAVTQLREVVHLAPTNRAGYVLLAQVLMSLNRKDEAYAQWVNLAEKQPNDPEAAFTAGAIAFEVLKRLPEAERWLRQAQTSSPKDPRVPLLLGRVLGMRGKTAAAAVVLAQGARQFPEVIELHTLLSDVRWAQGDKDGAISALRAAVPHIPASTGGGVPLARLHVAIGRLYAMRGQWLPAAREWRAATTLQPHDADVHGLLAEALWRSGDRAGTAAQLKQVLDIDPKRHDARHRLAKALADIGRYDEAQDEYATYLKAKPNDVGAMVQQAALYEHQADIPRAIESWNKVSTVWPENPLPALQRARLLRKSGNDTEALAQYRYALQIAPNDPQALSGAAILEEKSGQEMRALTHLRTLVSKQPDDEAAYAALLRVSEQKQQLPATLNFLKQQLAKNPRHRAAYAALLDGYAKSGDADTGRTVVKDFMARYPKLTAPRIALDSFDLARAKQQLADLRRAKPTLIPASATPIAAPLPTPIPNTTATTPSEAAPTKDDAPKPETGSESAPATDPQAEPAH